MTIIYAVTDVYDEYTKFLKKYNLGSSAVWHNKDIESHVFQYSPTLLLLIGSHDDMYSRILSLNRFNPRVSYIDYSMERYWSPEASLIMDAGQYHQLYQSVNDSPENERFTFFARLQEDYSVKVDFPDKEQAFKIGLML
jgi:hypothetical protein